MEDWWITLFWIKHWALGTTSEFFTGSAEVKMHHHLEWRLFSVSWILNLCFLTWWYFDAKRVYIAQIDGIFTEESPILEVLLSSRQWILVKLKTFYFFTSGKWTSKTVIFQGQNLATEILRVEQLNYEFFWDPLCLHLRNPPRSPLL